MQGALLSQNTRACLTFLYLYLEGAHDLVVVELRARCHRSNCLSTSIKKSRKTLCKDTRRSVTDITALQV